MHQICAKMTLDALINSFFDIIEPASAVIYEKFAKKKKLKFQYKQ
jgi:hypothetical protein